MMTFSTLRAEFSFVATLFFFGVLSTWPSAAFAVVPACNEGVPALKAMTRCSVKAIRLQEQINQEFARVLKKFDGVDETVQNLKRAHEFWLQYLGSQCIAEQGVPLAELRLRIEPPRDFRRDGVECVLDHMNLRLTELKRL